MLDDGPSMGSGGVPGQSGGATGGITGVGGSTGGAPSGGNSPGGATGGEASGEASVLVDDLEGQGLAYVNNPFKGEWMRYDEDGPTSTKWVEANAGDMVQERSPSPENYAMHVAGGPYPAWGAGVYVTLQQDGPIAPYDVSEWDGIRFSAKTDNAASKTLRVKVEDPHTHDDPDDPDDCEAPSTKSCNNHVASPVTLTSEWKTFEVPFANYSRTPAVDFTQIFSVHFTMDPAADASVDYWIDDVEFYKSAD